MERPWRQGESITFRDVHARRIKAAVSFVTVEHTEHRYVGWLPADGEFALPVDAAGNPVKDVMASHRLAELRWAMPGSPGQLMIALADVCYGVLLRFFGDDWRMPEWYVNLQSPLQRTAIGFDSTDYVLDLLVAADGTSWRWKDNDEFKAAVRAGFVSRERERVIRATGEHALELARARVTPFDDEFLGFRPDPEWEPPDLSRGWHELPV